MKNKKSIKSHKKYPDKYSYGGNIGLYQDGDPIRPKIDYAKLKQEPIYVLMHTKSQNGPVSDIELNDFINENSIPMSEQRANATNYMGELIDKAISGYNINQLKRGREISKADILDNGGYSEDELEALRKSIYDTPFRYRKYDEFRREFDRSGKTALSKIFKKVIPIETNKHTFDAELQKIPNNANIMYMDHAGEAMFGFDKKDFVSKLASKNPSICIGGSCYGEHNLRVEFNSMAPNTQTILSPGKWKGFNNSLKGMDSIVPPSKDPGYDNLPYTRNALSEYAKGGHIKAIDINKIGKKQLPLYKDGEIVGAGVTGYTGYTGYNSGYMGQEKSTYDNIASKVSPYLGFAGNALYAMSNAPDQRSSEVGSSVGMGLQGLSAGAMLGPAGAVLGGLGGAALGWFGAKKRNTEQEAREQMLQNAYMANASFDPTKYQDGGSIHIKESHKGDFTKYAKRKGMGVQEAAHWVMAHSNNKKLRKQATFALNSAGWNHPKKMAEGGEIDPPYTRNDAIRDSATLHDTDIMRALKLKEQIKKWGRNDFTPQEAVAIKDAISKYYPDIVKKYHNAYDRLVRYNGAFPHSYFVQPEEVILRVHNPGHILNVLNSNYKYPVSPIPPMTPTRNTNYKFTPIEASGPYSTPDQAPEPLNVEYYDNGVQVGNPVYHEYLRKFPTKPTKKKEGGNVMEKTDTYLSELIRDKNNYIIPQMFGGISGGKTPIIYLQAEKSEKIIMEDGGILDSKADEKHEKMGEREVTDILPQGAYIASSRKNQSIKKKKAEKEILGNTPIVYNEFEQGEEPEEIKLSDIFISKEMTPSELADVIKKKFKMVDRGQDPISAITNEENKIGRIPYLNKVMAMAEKKKTLNAPQLEEEEGVEKEKCGGFIKKYGDGGTPIYYNSQILDHGTDEEIANYLASIQGIPVSQKPITRNLPTVTVTAKRPKKEKDTTVDFITNNILYNALTSLTKKSNKGTKKAAERLLKDLDSKQYSNYFDYPSNAAYNPLNPSSGVANSYLNIYTPDMGRYARGGKVMHYAEGGPYKVPVNEKIPPKATLDPNGYWKIEDPRGSGKYRYASPEEVKAANDAIDANNASEMGKWKTNYPPDFYDVNHPKFRELEDPYVPEEEKQKIREQIIADNEAYIEEQRRAQNGVQNPVSPAAPSPAPIDTNPPSSDNGLTQDPYGPKDPRLPSRGIGEVTPITPRYPSSIPSRNMPIGINGGQNTQSPSYYKVLANTNPYDSAIGPDSSNANGLTQDTTAPTDPELSDNISGIYSQYIKDLGDFNKKYMNKYGDYYKYARAANALSNALGVVGTGLQSSDINPGLASTTYADQMFKGVPNYIREANKQESLAPIYAIARNQGVLNAPTSQTMSRLAPITSQAINSINQTNKQFGLDDVNKRNQYFQYLQNTENNNLAKSANAENQVRRQENYQTSQETGFGGRTLTGDATLAGRELQTGMGLERNALDSSMQAAAQLAQYNLMKRMLDKQEQEKASNGDTTPSLEEKDKKRKEWIKSFLDPRFLGPTFLR